MSRLTCWIALGALVGCQVAFDPPPATHAKDDRDASCERHQDCRTGERCEEFMCVAMSEAQVRR